MAWVKCYKEDLTYFKVEIPSNPFLKGGALMNAKRKTFLGGKIFVMAVLAGLAPPPRLG